MGLPAGTVCRITPPMSESSSASRVTIDGKFFRLGARKFHPKGVTYGPFAPTPQAGTFPARAQVLFDFDLLQQLGANLVRVYDVPPPWFLDLALAHDLRVLIDIPWSHQLCFLDRPDQERAALEAVRQAARACAGHLAVFAYSVANEIPAEIVRWHGPRRIARFIDRLAHVAREHDPGCLVTFCSFPPTEYLNPSALDFSCFNVFLEDRRAYEIYLARLQMVAGSRPLLLGECGIDSLRHGDQGQSELLSWQIETAFRMGLAGAIVFGFTDEWHRGGQPVVDWAFGLTTAQRELKPAFTVVQRQFRDAPYYRLSRIPRVSVVVACHNGQRTLKACLNALSSLGYPDYEVVLVDDGSSDGTAQIALGYPAVRYLRQDHHGLSAARNTGIAAASGEIIAFTDDDCRPDEDWLYYLVQELLAKGVAAAGGPNYLPPDDSVVAAAVMASPGGPTHVMLTDREAEHVPGCNLALWRWALGEINGFDPVFRRAGDDVDVCWRLLERGGVIRFSAAAFVWHYRRSTLGSYLTQQFGYGEAEALLAGKHPEYFTALGRSQWRGRLYAPARPGPALSAAVIYHGAFGTAPFQRVYQPGPETLGTLCTSAEYHALVTLPLLVLGLAWPVLLPLGLVSLLLSLGAAVMAAAQAQLPRGKCACWSRPLIGLLCFLQPVVRGWARYRWRFTARSVRPTTFRRAGAAGPGWWERPHRQLAFFSEKGVTRLTFIRTVIEHFRAEGWEHRTDQGWARFDLEVYGRRWTRLQLTTVAEELGQNRRVLRCRLHTAWSLPARWALGFLTGLSLVVSMSLAPQHPWIWSVWTLVPALAAIVHSERRTLVRLVASLVDEVARQLELQYLLPPNPDQPARPAPPKPPDRARDDLEELL
jgi:O-antigen biosynthesis protein